MGWLRDRIGIEIVCAGLKVMHDKRLTKFLGRTIDFGLQKAEEAEIMQAATEGVICLKVEPTGLVR